MKLIAYTCIGVFSISLVVVLCLVVVIAKLIDDQSYGAQWPQWHGYV